MIKKRKRTIKAGFMDNIHKFSFLFFFLISFIIISNLDSCKSHRHRTQEKERIERNSKRKSEIKAKRREKEEHNGRDYNVNTELAQSDRIQKIAESGDINAMLRCLENAVAELRQLRKDYFANKVTDKEAEERMDAIKEKYQPVLDSLEKAQNNGELKYKDHKKQMKLIADVVKEFLLTYNTLKKDFINSFQ